MNANQAISILESALASIVDDDAFSKILLEEIDAIGELYGPLDECDMSEMLICLMNRARKLK